MNESEKKNLKESAMTRFIAHGRKSQKILSSSLAVDLVKVTSRP